MQNRTHLLGQFLNDLAGDALHGRALRQSSIAIAYLLSSRRWCHAYQGSGESQILPVCEAGFLSVSEDRGHYARAAPSMATTHKGFLLGA